MPDFDVSELSNSTVLYSSNSLQVLVEQAPNHVLSSFVLSYKAEILAFTLHYSFSSGFKHCHDAFDLGKHSEPAILNCTTVKEGTLVPLSALVKALKKVPGLGPLLLKDIVKKLEDANLLQSWYVYMIRSDDNSLYTGITTDVERRLSEHRSQNKKSAKYFRSKKAVEMVWLHETANRSIASKLEYLIKKMKKREKEELVKNETNLPDLYL